MFALTGEHEFFDLFDLAAERLVGLDEVRHSLARVEHRSVVAASDGRSDRRERGLGVLLGQIHGDLTRFKWGLSAQLNTPDYDTKLKIIRVKAQKFGAQISDDVVAYLADNISANVREIEGALSSLVANASFLGRRITTSLAKEILKVYVKLYQKEVTIDHIIEVVCEYLNLDFARFNSTERTREIAQARQIAMYLAKQHTKAPLTTIGSAIGGRNHATVLHSCKAVTNLIETDKAFRRQVEEIEKKVLAQ